MRRPEGWKEGAVFLRSSSLIVGPWNGQIPLEHKRKTESTTAVRLTEGSLDARRTVKVLFKLYAWSVAWRGGSGVPGRRRAVEMNDDVGGFLTESHPTTFSQDRVIKGGGGKIDRVSLKRSWSRPPPRLRHASRCARRRYYSKRASPVGSRS